MQVQERDGRGRRRARTRRQCSRSGSRRTSRRTRSRVTPARSCRDYIKAGQVEPIDFIYKQYGFDKIMPKGLINQITYNGHLYSVPVNIHRANMLWYNPRS